LDGSSGVSPLTNELITLRIEEEKKRGSELALVNYARDN
jgi:hypothetical protein